MKLIKAIINSDFSEEAFKSACAQLREQEEQLPTVVLIIAPHIRFSAARLLKKYKVLQEQHLRTAEAFSIPYEINTIVNHSFNAKQWLLLGKDHIVVTEAS